jgi:hypothetical protein
MPAPGTRRASAAAVTNREDIVLLFGDPASVAAPAEPRQPASRANVQPERACKIAFRA